MQWKYVYKMRHHHQYFLCLIELNFSPVSSNVFSFFLFFLLLLLLSRILIYECCFQMAPLIFVYMSTMTKHNSMFFDVLFRFMQPILLDATAWVHMSEQFCVYFVAWKFFFIFIVQAFRWSQEIKTKEWNKWNITRIKTDDFKSAF